MRCSVWHVGAIEKRKDEDMRFPCLIMVIVTTVSLLAGSPAAMAKHRYCGNWFPGSNCVNRCLGIGWSDGYHAYGSRSAWNPWPVATQPWSASSMIPSQTYSHPSPPAGEPVEARSVQPRQVPRPLHQPQQAPVPAR